jgi:hypothetical protein
MAKQVEGNEEISDDCAAECSGWNKHTAKRHRLALFKNDWFLVERHNIAGNKMHIYYLGKEVVEHYKASHNIKK